MTGKVLDGNPTSLLILILPFAVGIVILYKAWPFLLLLLVLTICWRIWDKYQWKQWCQRVNPSFNQLIQENQGRLTPMDLSAKANLTGGAAQRFLDRKAEEYGAQRKTYKEQGIVYYFLTASALGSIFDDSEPLSAKEIEALDSSPPAENAIAQLDELKQSSQAPNITDSSSLTELTLIQADLAKRLDINSSTIGRRKSEPDFPEWSQSKDPEGIAWTYVPTTKMFVPQKSKK